MSRSTFRRRRTEVAYQKEIRDRHLSEGTPPVPHLSVKKARVRPVSRKLAEQVILKYEWLGTMAGTSYHFGIFFGPFVAGVTCVGTAVVAGVHRHKTFGLKRSSDLLTLARGACVHWAPPGTNSKLISWTVRLLRELELGKLLIAYADTDAGEIGTVYQASNWTCIGPGSSLTEYVSPHGRPYNQQILKDRSKNRPGVTWKDVERELLAQGWTKQRSNPKIRYVAVLDLEDDELVRRVRELEVSYPKRTRTLEGGRPGPPVGGGSSPTRPLQVSQ